MCKLFRDPLTDQMQFATFTSHDVVPCKEDRQRMLEALVNGEFLFSDYRSSVPHALLRSVSTISALSKELEMDLASGRTLITKSDVDDVAREFGRYVYLPVMQFQSIMKRLLYCSWSAGSHYNLQRLIVKFLKLFEDVDVESRAMVITASHLLFALYSAKLYDCGRHKMPFSLSVNSRGKFYLVYHYVSKKMTRQRIIRWDLGFRLPSSPNPNLTTIINNV